MDTAQKVLKSVIAKLLATPSITDIVGIKIMSFIPQKTNLPYIRIEIMSEDDSTLSTPNLKHAVRIQGFLQDTSPARALTLRESIFAAMNRTELSLDGGLFAVSEFNGTTECFEEKDGEVWQIVVDFDVYIQ
jgi:hypothetical protein